MLGLDVLEVLVDRLFIRHVLEICWQRVVDRKSRVCEARRIASGHVKKRPISGVFTADE
jgi:hypothetical protein